MWPLSSLAAQSLPCGHSKAALRAPSAPRMRCIASALCTASTSGRAAPRPRRAPRAASAARASKRSIDSECFAGIVALDNESDPRYTVLRVEADDFAGLIRVLAWTLTGLGLNVCNALIQTDGGVASDLFFVTDNRGRKLSDSAALEVTERLQDMVDDVCRTNNRDGEFSEARVGSVILLTNDTHPTCTELTITPEVDSPGLLLDLASVIHGMGISIVEGVIRGAGPVAPPGGGHLKVDPIASVPEPPEGRRTMRFMLQEAQSGRQLDYATASGLLYALQLVTGRSTPTQLPNIYA
ncbi:MAG: hypothetical protein J3K34DRAFT_104686 [Monoraphidium minutum]|nr:MAG: hypothetical protein J3K34DRAFT_104686 [Monoraphidium minutum]